MAKALNTLGDVYYFKNEYERSIHFYERAITLTRRINNKLVLGYSLFELAIVLLVDGQYDKVKALLTEASDLANELSNDAFKFDVRLLEAKYIRQTEKNPSCRNPCSNGKHAVQPRARSGKIF